jgi:hypothetical protein
MSKNKFSCALGADGGRDTSPLASRHISYSMGDEVGKDRGHVAV